MIKSLALTLLALLAPAVAGADDCMNAFERGWNPPPFECPFGLPNPQCLWEAQIAYEQYMQMASFTLCQTLNGLEDWYNSEIQQCTTMYEMCLAAGEGPEHNALCLMSFHNCVQPVFNAYNNAVSLAYSQFDQDMADAQDQFYTSALDCCPQ
jgi:hypothetical protein